MLEKLNTFFVVSFYSHSIVADLQTPIDKGLQARK